MPAHVIVIEKRGDFRWADPGQRVMTVADYLDKAKGLTTRNARIINLARDFDYLSVGYYCSLLAEARLDRVIPSVSTILELDRKTIYDGVLGALGELEVYLRRCLKDDDEPGRAVAFTVPVYFGLTDDAVFAELALQVFGRFRAPLLDVEIRHQDGAWTIGAIEMLSPRDIPLGRDRLFLRGLKAYTRKRWVQPRARAHPRYDLAILHDPDDKLPPTDGRTLQKFVRIGAELGIDVELITRKDYAKLAQFDALFIRETTSIPHHTFRFAKKAEKEGMPVIDDPTSILRCTNKVYLAELLRANDIPTPKTMILGRNRVADVVAQIDFPVVLKIPDGSFSRGVKKAQTVDELAEILKTMFKESQMVLAQEYMYTEFDWRVGILNRQPIFVCQYFMSKKHWQIVKHGSGGGFSEGASRTFPVAEAPEAVVQTALRAANLVGDGLYGVDLKQTAKGVFVIEINDNPNIDMGVEDAVLKDELYRVVLREFQRRIDLRRTRGRL